MKYHAHKHNKTNSRKSQTSLENFLQGKQSVDQPQSEPIYPPPSKKTAGFAESLVWTN